MRTLLFAALLVALLAAVVVGSCYKTTDDPPCANIAHRPDDPAGLPPVWDRRARDAGADATKGESR